jgi:hypothetical protein
MRRGCAHRVPTYLERAATSSAEIFRPRSTGDYILALCVTSSSFEPLPSDCHLSSILSGPRLQDDLTWI